MHTEVKRCVDNKDIKGLRYIFVDCLDVDPTFEKYKEDYEYCKNISGLFQTYVELTPLKMDKAQWNKQYWEKLKLDLIKNFSIKRFEHMIEVAKVIYADKISRLLHERNIQQQDFEKKLESVISTANQSRVGSEKSKSNISGKMTEQKKLEEAKRKLEKENQREEAERQEKEKKLNAQRAEYAKKGSEKEKNDSKKSLGIVLIMAIVAIILLVKIL